ncbi:MAG: hypothetical protein AAFX85_08800 [Pseudomonadota bacterium]
MAVAVSGCGGRQAVCEENPSYGGRLDGRELEVPEDLDAPRNSGRFDIPPVAAAVREVDARCTAYPPRIAGVAEAKERESRRQRRAAEREREAAAQAQAASDAAGGLASNPRVAPTPPEPQGEPVDSGRRVYRQVFDAVGEWARAWEERDLQGYLDAYSSDFVPPAPMTRRQWEDVREQRMSEGAQAFTDLESLEVYQTPEKDSVIARFEQNFAFESIQSTISKELWLVRERRSWRIVAERVIAVE